MAEPRASADRNVAPPMPLGGGLHFGLRRAVRGQRIDHRSRGGPRTDGTGPFQRSFMRRFVVAFSVFLSLLLVGQAKAGEAYYLLMFGAQRVPADPDYS